MTASRETENAHTTRAVQIARTCAYYAAFITLGFVAAAIGPSLPSFAQNTASQLHQVSILFAARSGGYLLGAYQAGRWLDRLPGHMVMAAAVLMMAALMFIIPLVPWLPLLAAALLILGITNGVLDVSGNTLLVWVHGRTVGPFMNGLHLVWGVGAFLSPLAVAASLKARGDVSGAFWIMAFSMLPVAAWLLSLPSPAPQAQYEGRAINLGWGNRLVVLLVCLLCLYGGAEAGFGGWVYTYTVRTGLGTEQTAATLTSIYWAALTAGRLLGIPLAARVSPERVVLTDLVVALLSISLILAWPDSVLILGLGTLCLGLSLATVFPMVLSIAGRSLTITGRVSRWFFVGSSVGSMSVPWLMGQSFERIGPQAAMATVLVCACAALLVYAGVRRQVTAVQIG